MEKSNGATRMSSDAVLMMLSILLLYLYCAEKLNAC
jgi:hypothetical protein